MAEMEKRTLQEDAREGGQVDRSASIEKKTRPEPNAAESSRVENKYKKKISYECEGREM